MQNMKWNEKVKDLMDQKGMKQKELSKKSGITEPSICRYLKGDRIPRIDIIVNFARALEVDVDYLLNENVQTFNAYESIKNAVSRNGKNLTEEEQEELIKIIRGRSLNV